MLIVLEGPDYTGKSTCMSLLVERLRGPVYVPTVPIHRCLYPYMFHVQTATDALWRCLYDPTRCYVADRHCCVSERVYSQLKHRPCGATVPPWDIHVVHFDCSAEVLAARAAMRSDEYVTVDELQRLRELYLEVVKDFRTHTVDASLSVEEVYTQVAAVVRGLCQEH